MVDSTYTPTLITKFGGAFTALDGPDVPPNMATLAENVEFFEGIVRSRKGFSTALTTSEAVTSAYNWNSGLGNFWVRFRSSDNSIRAQNIASLADSVLVAGNLGGHGAIFAEAGARLYAALFTTASRGTGAGRVVSFQSAAFVSDTLFQPPITYTPAAPSEPGAGVITKGTKRLGFIIEYRGGFFTRPSPDSGSGTPSFSTFQPVLKTAAGSLNFEWVLNTAWPTGAVKVHVIMSPTSNGSRFFFVPGANIAVVGGTTHSVTITFSISDDDLIAFGREATYYLLLSTQTVAGVAPFNPYVVLPYSDRMVYVTTLNDNVGNAVGSMLISEKGFYQELSLDQHLLQLPGQLDITTVLSIGGTLYIFSPYGTFATVDNGDVPAAWPAPTLIDGEKGTLAIRGAELAPAGDYGWVADQGGLYYFNGRYPDNPVSYYQADIWDRINWNAGHTLQIKDDATQNKVSVLVPLDTATTPSHIMSWDYTNGFEPSKVNFSLDFLREYSPAAMEIVSNTLSGAVPAAAKHKELWLASSAAAVVMRKNTTTDVAPYRDGSQGVLAQWESGPFPGKRARGQNFLHHGGDYRVRGIGSVQITTYGLDRVRARPLDYIALEESPGKEYHRGFYMMSEGVGHRITSNLLRSPGFEF